MKKFKFLIFFALGFILFAKSSVVYASRSIPVIIHGGVSTGVNVKLDNNNPVLVQPETPKFFNDLGDGSDHTVSVEVPQGYSVRYTVCPFPYSSCPVSGIGSSVSVNLDKSQTINWWFEPTSSSAPPSSSAPACLGYSRIDNDNGKPVRFDGTPYASSTFVVGSSFQFQGWSRFCYGPRGANNKDTVDLWLCPHQNDLAGCVKKIGTASVVSRADGAAINDRCPADVSDEPADNNHYGWQLAGNIPTDTTPGSYYLYPVTFQSDPSAPDNQDKRCWATPWAPIPITITAAPAIVTSYRVADNPTDLTNAEWKPYTSSEIEFEFKDKNPGNKFIYMELKDSSGATESHNVQIQLVNFSCSSASPSGLSDTGQLGPNGIKIYTTADYRGGRKQLSITRSPADTIIQPSAAGLSFETAADGNKLVVIPDNMSTTADVDYTVSTNLSYFGATTSCIPFMIRVPKATADASCPANITSTQAKLRTSTQDPWGTEKTIALGQSVFVGGFHNNNINPPFVSDTRLKTTGPEGATSHEDSLNNLDDADTSNDNNLSYTPTEPGRYTIAAAVKDKTGGSCTGTATLTVSPASEVTTAFRVAEDPGQFDIAEGQAGFIPWKAYTGVPTIYNDFEFKDKTPGAKFIWVEFKSNKKTERHNIQIKLLGSEPTITSCALGFEGNNTVLNLTGQNLGTVKGTAESDETNLQVSEWKNTSAKVIWPNAPVGQTLSATLTTPDGQQALANCSSVSQLSVGAKVFCKSSLSQDITNVDLTLAGRYQGGTVVKQKVSIDRAGVIQGLNQKLEAGKKYKLSLKARGTLRKTSDEFKAEEGTTNLNFVLPVGDIFPPDGDGVINSADKAELNRQWNIFEDTTGRSGDLNGDSRINSVDWACMRLGFNVSEDSEPAAGGQSVVTVSPSPSSVQSPSPTTSSATSPSPSPSVSPSPATSP